MTVSPQPIAVPAPVIPGESLEQLKQKFIVSLGDIWQAGSNLRHDVLRLLQRGVTASTLVRWAVEAGHTESYARTVVSKILRELGLCRRKAGAGRQTPQEALTILAWAHDKYGDHATKYLLAAYRAAKAEKAQKSAHGPSPTANVTA